MKKVRVLQVLDYINNNSGVSSVVMNYYSHIDSSKVQIDFLLYENPEETVLEYLNNNHSQIYTTGYPVEEGYIRYKSTVREFFEKNGRMYDIVHVHIPSAAFIVLKEAKKAGIRTRIMHAHNTRGADGIVKKVRNYLLNKWGMFYTNEFFACSRLAAEYLYGKNKSQYSVIINNAIDLKKFSYNQKVRESIRKELGIKNEIILGHVGRFAEQKNHKFLLEIMKELQKLNNNYKLLLLGDGSLREDIEMQIKKLGLENNVVLLGVVSNVKEYLDAIDIFLLPSKYEGLPCVCVEAQANGLPCLISSSITKEVELTDNIKFLEIQNASKWCAEIIKLAEKLNVDRQETNKDARINDYNIEIQAKLLEERYLEYGIGSSADVHL